MRPIAAILAGAKSLLQAKQGGPSGAPEAALEAAVLLTYVSGLSRAQILAHGERVLPAGAMKLYDRLLARRLHGEPLAYITGHREFYGLDFAVDRRVLIPRPETELLVELAIAEAKRRSGTSPLVADIGTGSGAIAISIAKSLTAARVFAVDISPAALDVAAENSRRHAATSLVSLLQGDLLDALPLPVDILVANLPYIAEDIYPTLQREVLDYEPSLALLAGPDGLSLYRRLLRQAAGHLRPGATLLLELDPSQVPSIRQEAERHLPLTSIDLARDYSGMNRVVMIRLRQ